MKEDEKIQAYLKTLGKFLRTLPNEEKEDIVFEIKAHITE